MNLCACYRRSHASRYRAASHKTNMIVWCLKLRPVHYHLLSNGRSKLLRNRSEQDLRDLFTLRSHTSSDTYDCMCISHLTDADSERLLATPGRWRNQASIHSPAKSVMHTCRSCLAACRLVIVHMAAQLPEHEYRHGSS